MGKRDFGNIKCLLHFDFPYFNEPNDGLDDDVGIATWSKENSNVALWGSKIPKAGTQAPKFGHRCLYPYTGGAVCTNTTGIWNMNSNGDYEIEFFVLPKAHGSTRYLLRDNSARFSVSLNASGYITVSISTWGVSSTSTEALVENSWQHVMLRISNGILKVFIDSVEALRQALTPSVELSISKMRLGYFDDDSYPIFIDEFVFRHSAGSGAPNVPTHPYSGRLDISKIGGYRGYGGNLILDSNITSDRQLNSYGLISSIASTSKFTVSSWNNGSYTGIATMEVMIHITAPRSTTSADYPLVGLYAFAKIETISSTTVTLDRAISTANGDDFTLDSSLLDTYYVQAIVVPRFSSLIIDSDVTVTPLTWSTTTGGGIVAFRTTGDCTINGNILTHGKGAIRYDYLQGTNSKLIDRFLCSQGGGIFISCGGTLTIDSSARLGASWSGAVHVSNGAAGHGGDGGYGYTTSSTRVLGGNGGIGGGGSGGIGAQSNSHILGTNVGEDGRYLGGRTTGGGGCGGSGGENVATTLVRLGGAAGGGQANSGGSAGTGYKTAYDGNPANGVNGGDHFVKGINASCYISGSGGGAPGGNGGNGGIYEYDISGGISLAGGIAGASIILITKKLNTAVATLSTGGGAGTSSEYVNQRNYVAGASGGGTGFCYIACEGQVS